MDGFRSVLCLRLLALVLVVQCEETRRVTLTEEAFRGLEQLRQVKCGIHLDGQTTVNIVKLRDMRDVESPLITFKSLKKEDQCITSTSFAACEITETMKEVSVIVSDLEEESRQYECEIKGYYGEESFTKDAHINVTVPASVRTPTTEMSLDTVRAIESKDVNDSGSDKATHKEGEETASASGVGVVWVVVLLLAVLVLAVLCGVLGFKFYRDSRKRESNNTPNLDLDTVSFKSGVTDKDFALMTLSRRAGGGGMYAGGGPPGGMIEMGGTPGRYVRQYSSPGYPPPAAEAPGVPGGRQPFVMQYQTPGTLCSLPVSDAGYMSDAGQYQQPWGQPLRDPEILSQMSSLQRPNPRVVKIPNFEAASASPPADGTPAADGTPPSVYQDGTASLNDAE